MTLLTVVTLLSLMTSQASFQFVEDVCNVGYVPYLRYVNYNKLVGTWYPRLIFPNTTDWANTTLRTESYSIAQFYDQRTSATRSFFIRRSVDVKKDGRCGRTLVISQIDEKSSGKLLPDGHNVPPYIPGVIYDYEGYILALTDNSFLLYVNTYFNGISIKPFTFVAVMFRNPQGWQKLDNTIKKALKKFCGQYALKPGFFSLIEYNPDRDCVCDPDVF